MKNLTYILLLVLAFSFQTANAQAEIKIDANTVIKDKDGNKVELMDFITLAQSGDYIINQEKDKDGNPYLQLIELSEEEKAKAKKNKKEAKSENELIGTKAPAFEMKDLNDNPITSKSTKGKVVVLNFWFTSCKPCVSEMPELNEVHQKYKDNKNVVFASITFDSKKIVETFLKKHTLDYPIVANDKQTISNYKISAYPSNIIIDKEGNYSNIMIGGFPGVGKSIEASIEKALK